ncbi:phage holin family protein [Roseospira visakhapatnamensis]|uniref:LydA family holin superfamily III n=1 Tax=Roseospira visakhapatnamensis TaxID=390880 RepID=A0A7W6WAA9_9PROT|nr:phage holin family protein [Roseospira visakhapatnamensis]MBB4266286.1 hypothetical protein [Roseospira visakhapatnamensis]
MSDQPPPTFVEMLIPGAWLALVAGLARLLHHHRLVSLGQRRLLSWSLMWELPTAALCAVLGAGAAEWLGAGLTSPLAAALVGVLSLLGPRGIETTLARILDHYYPEDR